MQSFHHVYDPVKEPLYCVVPVFNPFRWKSRWKHTERAVKHFIDSGAVVYLVEVGFNRRELAFANSGLDGLLANCQVTGGSGREFRHRYIGLHTKDELWLKENAINIGVQNFPFGWEQVAWLDSDVHFLRPNWVGETIHKLQHYAFLQMFSHARDASPQYEVMPERYPHADGPGFVRAWQDGWFEPIAPRTSVPAELRATATESHNEDTGGYYPGAMRYGARTWPGLAWAARRDAWDAVGGLLDIAIWGGADWHMAHALIEQRQGMMRDDLHKNYKKVVNQWYERCRTHIRRNVGMMEGSVFHYWHGRKEGRGYNSKHALLAKVGFDPPRHLKRDSQGVWQLHDDRSTAYVQLRDLMRKIARERDEDSNDTRMDLWEQGH